MKATFETDDPFEIKRLAKSEDMALCLWEIVNNTWQEFSTTDHGDKKTWDKINQIISNHNLDVYDLIGR